jgi:dTDP-4-dehydrorhamnose reductase
MKLYESIVITGGGGMLANALSEALNQRNAPSAKLSRADLDITDHAQLRNVFERYKPTLLLNCAAHTKVDLCETEPDKAAAINGYAVGEMAKLSREFGTCLVQVSTDFVFDGSLRRPYRADDAVNPMQQYGKSKLLGESQLRANAPKDWLIVRTAWVYGRHGANFPRTMVTAAKAGKPLKVVADQYGCPTYTVDLANGILDLLEAGGRGLWHLTNNGQTNWRDFAQAAVNEFGINAEVAPLSSAQWAEMRPSAAARPGYSVLDIEAYSTMVGKPMRPWREALRDYRAAVEKDGF